MRNIIGTHRLNVDENLKISSCYHKFATIMDKHSQLVNPASKYDFSHAFVDVGVKLEQPQICYQGCRK